MVIGGSTYDWWCLYIDQNPAVKIEHDDDGGSGADIWTQSGS